MKLVNLLILIATSQVPVSAASAGALQQTTQEKCLRGRVISAVSVGNYRSDVLVMLRGDLHDERISTVVGGVFSFCNVPSGNYLLEATAPGYNFWRQPISNRSGSSWDSNVTIVLEPIPPPATPPRGFGGVSVKALRISPEAHREHDRFLQHATKGDWEKSLQSLERAVTASPEYFDAWNNMGIILAKMNRNPEAEAAFIKAIKIDPGSSVARRNLGHHYLVRGQMKEAQTELELAAKLNPRDARTQVYLGHLLNETGKPTEAEELLKQALALEPEMPLALYQMGFVNLRLNRPREALGWFNRFLRQEIVSPASDEVRTLVARIQTMPGQ